MKKRWIISPIDQKAQLSLAASLNISPVTAGVLLKKGVNEKTAASFLNKTGTSFYDPLLLPNMQAAVARIKAAIYKKELITIFGDYDVDGITSTVVLYKTLQELGASVQYYLPDRQLEGYGVHKASIDKFINKTKLLITVDCGIRSISELEYASDYMDVIVTDHHLPGDELPEAIAVIDPKRADCEYPDKNLAGVGVAFKLCQALWQNIKNEEFTRYLDVVALGTVADIVPLTNENRTIVKRGLANITNLGILELINICKLDKNTITAGHIGFVLGPRLNAAGRLKHADMGVELLLSCDSSSAHKLAEALDKENSLRQQLVETVFKEAMILVHKNNYTNNKLIVVCGKNWHPGIIGIVASRLVDEFYLPTVVISIDNNGVGKGSCRSIKNFNIVGALSACNDNLTTFGGHAMAAGLTIESSQINFFRDNMIKYAAANIPDSDLIPSIEVDQVLSPQAVNKAMIAELTLLEPFGVDNPAPLFLCGGIQPCNIKKIGQKGVHLKFTFLDNNYSYTALGWNMGKYADIIENNKIDFIFQPEINNWNDKKYIQFILKDIKLSQSDKLYPSREFIGIVYLTLKHIYPAGQKPIKIDLSQIITHLKTHLVGIDEKTITYCLNVLAEIQIISINWEKKLLKFLPIPKMKKDLNTSNIFLKRYQQ
ncbi:single-stranded-DNA-specific exonuclease RecJ [Pectinatus frisingensis]|uniref:single-stranded-DNA-specific exonuclease RecJ n=1 Tax=Pectinatus frisingensis TaxID=865 RepID=UPI0018C4E48A|nr:single-stranded-DNA-specific exonuclease RecJ [Pectinatus frisingensis]